MFISFLYFREIRIFEKVREIRIFEKFREIRIFDKFHLFSREKIVANRLIIKLKIIKYSAVNNNI